jgi:dihydrofolate reductase
MSRLIQWNMLSLDGYFEGAKSWDVEWFQGFFSKELEEISIEQLSRADALLFGRVTYEGMAAYWQTAQGEVADFMNNLPKVVFSRTLERADWANTRLVKSDAVAEVRELKGRGSRDLYVFGSGDLCAGLMAAGLFDEVRLGLIPIVVGRGTTLFGRGLSRRAMKLLEARPLANGCVILRYEPRQGE